MERYTFTAYTVNECHLGALLQVSSGSGFVVFLSAIAILIASINIAGGFLVTQRMLKMFRK